MSFFDRRTDTEKELEAYHKSHSADKNQNPYDYANQNQNNDFKPDISANNGNTTPKSQSNQKRKFNPVAIILFIVVAVIILIFLFCIFANKSLIYIFNENIFLVLFGFVFFLVGAIMLYVGIAMPKKDKARCSVAVKAEIVDVQSRISTDENSSTCVYAPVYKFYYQGQVYKVRSTLYSNERIIVGTDTEIAINPLNPNDFIEPSRRNFVGILLTVMGVMFAFAGIFVMLTIAQFR